MTNDDSWEVGGAKHPKRWYALVVLAVGLAMIILDGTIAGVALPAIVKDLNLDLTDAQWINSLYSVVFAALLLTLGRLGDKRGRKLLFIAGLAVFTCSSAIGAQATNGSVLILARALQGIGGAMILPATLSTLNSLFRDHERAVAFGVWGAVIAGAAAIGPLLGGWLTTTFRWQLIFLVNVPIGVAIVLAAVFLVPETRRPDRSGIVGTDFVGLLTSSFGFGLLAFALIESTDYGWWAPKQQLNAFGLVWPTSAFVSPVPVALLLGVGLVGVFTFWEIRLSKANAVTTLHKAALLDVTLFRYPRFIVGNITALTVAAGEFAIVFVLPLFLVNVLQLSIMRAGWVLAAMAVGALISGAQARHLSARLGAPRVVVVGLGLECVGILVTALFVQPRVSGVVIAACLVVYGVGLGLASAQLTSVVLADIPIEQSGSASATQSTMRQLGAALGSAIAGTALATQWSHGTRSELSHVRGLTSSQINSLTSALVDSAGNIIPELRVPGRGMPAVVDALVTSFANATRFSLFVAACALIIGLLCSLRLARLANK